MEITKEYFYQHELTIENNKWKIDLSYESSYAKDLKLELLKEIPIIQIVDNGKYYSAIKIDVTNKKGKTKSCILTGIDGAVVLYNSKKEDEGKSAMIYGDNIILSLGFTLASINLDTLDLNWKKRPDPAEIFEFYQYQNDIILRGELDIHRIKMENGKTVWKFHGKDIWINMKGNEEVKLNENDISLCDWENTKYLIDYNGKLISTQNEIVYREVFFKKEPKLWLKLKFKEFLRRRKSNINK